jgi:hypothetical protein
VNAARYHDNTDAPPGMLMKANAFAGEGLRKFVLSLSLRGEKLDKMDKFSLSDPYLQVHRWRAGHWDLACHTETINDTLNPAWRPLLVRLTDLWSNGEEFADDLGKVSHAGFNFI